MGKSEPKNGFEFVTVASARARQLLRGCTPKVESRSPKKARVAMREVKAGAVRKTE
ncbi:MAG TPA: DNA-directed RNA polymerase subunit omega [Vicinamibacterales bacterium]|nr:DNA-directed RNA polymerase subunit omega [Vicinamibacterales bacterium]